MILLLYKPLRVALSKSQLLPAPDASTAKQSRMSIGVLLIAAFIILTCVLFVLSFRDII
jgi:hypothetical protein